MRRRRTRAKHAAIRARGEGVQLAWARDRDGAKVRAARLEPGDRRARAPFTCLGCGDRLVPHLGKRRARHFAHRAGSSCPLTAPETALHLDAKERLLALCADAFAGVRSVSLATRCSRCRRAVPRDLRALGDAAIAEGALGPLRADVLVTSRGRPALAVLHAARAPAGARGTRVPDRRMGPHASLLRPLRRADDGQARRAREGAASRWSPARRMAAPTWR